MPFPLPPSDSGSATSACPERNQRRALSASSVMKSHPVSSLRSELCALSVSAVSPSSPLLSCSGSATSACPERNQQRALSALNSAITVSFYRSHSSLSLSPTIPAHTSPPGRGDIPVPRSDHRFWRVRHTTRATISSASCSAGYIMRI